MVELTPCRYLSMRINRAKMPTGKDLPADLDLVALPIAVAISTMGARKRKTRPKHPKLANPRRFNTTFTKQKHF